MDGYETTHIYAIVVAAVSIGRAAQVQWRKRARKAGPRRVTSHPH